MQRFSANQRDQEGKTCHNPAQTRTLSHNIAYYRSHFAYEWPGEGSREVTIQSKTAILVYEDACFVKDTRLVPSQVFTSARTMDEMASNVPYDVSIKGMCVPW